MNTEENLQNLNEFIKKNVIGLTGGVATGKSTVAKFLNSKGFYIIDADQLAREAIIPGSIGYQKIIQAFGEYILDKSGVINRKTLGDRVFASSDDRKTLESILHPLIFDLMVKLIKKYIAENKPIRPIFYEASLIFETGTQDRFKEIWVTACNLDEQIRRLCIRNKLDLEHAKKVISAQLPVSSKVERADYVIFTDKEPDEYFLQLENYLTDRFGDLKTATV